MYGLIDWFSRLLGCLWGIIRDMPLTSLYFPEVVILGRWVHWGCVHCTTSACLCTHPQDSLQFIQCYCVHAVKRAKSRFPSTALQKFALFSSTLFTVEVNSKLSHTSAGVRLERISMSSSTLCTFYTTAAASGYLWKHESQISAMLASVSSISGIPVLGLPPYWCTLKFTASFVVSHNRCRTANFTDITFAKRKLALNTLRKVKSVRTTQSNTRFFQITIRPGVADLLPDCEHTITLWLIYTVYKSVLTLFSEATPELSLSLMLRPMVSRPVCLGIKHPSGAYDQIFISVRKTEYVWQLRSWIREAPSLTRGRVCLLYVPLALASAVFLGS
jgi:hypothetical protein